MKEMNEILQNIIKKLEDKGIKYNLIRLKDKAMTVQDVIKFSDVKINPNEICKTLILKDRENNTYAVVLIGNHRAGFNKIRKRFNCSELRMATPDEIRQETGLEIGAVCPLFLDLTMLIDRRVFSRKKVNFGSGDHLFGIEVNPKDIMKCTKSKISDIVAD